MSERSSKETASDPSGRIRAREQLVEEARLRSVRLSRAAASDRERVHRSISIDDLRSLGARPVRGGDADAYYDDSPAPIRKLRKFRDDPLRFLADSKSRVVRTLGVVLTALRNPDDVRTKR